VRRSQQILTRLWAKPDQATLRRLFSPGKERGTYDLVARSLLIQLLGPHSRTFKPLLRFLGIPHDRDGFHTLSPYALAEILYRRYDSNDQLIRDVCQNHRLDDDGRGQLAVRFLLFQSDIRIRPEYRELLFG
jgi:hypothetical protein